MFMKAGFLLLAVAVLQVPSEYIEPKFIEDVIYQQNQAIPPEMRIVSGWEAKLGQHPHHANLRLVSAVGGVSSCGGSFVHREWLLTAAHCTALRITIVVRGGLVSLTRPEYFFETNQYWNYPSYDNSIPGVVQPNDISIVKLQRPVTFTRNLQPIRVQPANDAFKNYGDLVLHASGHGRTWTDGSQPEVLRWVYLRGLNNAVCAPRYVAGLVTDNTICAQWYNVTSQSTCQGDSGGPLVHVNSEGERILVGVTSFVAGGTFGCHSGFPAGFIRPAPFHSWFTEVSGINFDNLKEDEDGDEITTPSPPPEDEEEDGSGDDGSGEDGSGEDGSGEDGSGEEDSGEEDSGEEDNESGEEDSSVESSEEDEDLSQLLKHLQVKVKVKVNINQFKGKKHSNKKIVKKVHK